jgi:branched-chain amino acid transport system permease protein
MSSPEILAAAVLNGLMSGAVYALIAVGLTLVYGVLHIINFAHGAILSAAMFAAYLAFQAGIDPYVAIVPLALLFFALGYALQRFIIGPASHGDDQNVLLITLGLSIVIENFLLAAFKSDTRSIDVPYGFSTFDLGFTFLAVPRVAAFGVSCVVAFLLWILLAHTDTGKAIRAVAREKLGASLAGIDVPHIYALTFGLGATCLAIAACLLLPTYYVHPRVGNAYVLVAFTIVVLGGMGSIPGAIVGGLFVGVVESLCGLYFGESLGQLGIFVLFILVLLVRPTGLFGAKA